MTIALYAVGIVALTYLIYRYGRYNPWRSTPIGRAFMASKTSLWAIFLYALAVTIWPDEPWQGAARLILVGYALTAIFYQLQVVIKFQGGFRRRQFRGQGAGHDEG